MISLLAILLPLVCKAVNPAPVNPTPNPTPSQSDAWLKAWDVKSSAVDNWDGQSYRPRAITKAAAAIRKEKKRDGTPIKKHEAQRLGIIALDDIRTASMPEIYSNVLEAEHHS